MTANETVRTSFLRGLMNYAIMEPLHPINDSCTHNLEMEKKCSDFPDVFIGPRSTPARVGHLIQFGCDVDVLEIHLNELYNVVDYFFITESVRAHKLNTPKPLTWPIVSKQTRFQKFLDKIVYFPLTDQILATAKDSKLGIWANENAQEQLRWKLFLEWNKKHNDYFGPNDVLGFGDTDEIASYQNVLLLKNCQQRGPTDVGIWFTFGKINKKFRCDWNIRTNQYAYGDPTYYTLQDAMKAKEYPSRNRGHSPYYLLGGLHMTLYQYLPSVTIKALTETEGGATEMTALFNLVKKNVSIFKLETGFSDFMQNKWKSSRLVPLDPKDLGTPPYILPWFLKCNLNRYSSFTLNPIPDKRLLSNDFIIPDNNPPL